MSRWIIALLVVLAAAGAGYWYATRGKDGTDGTALQPPPRPMGEMHRASDGAEIAKDCDDLAHSIRAAISRGRAIPEGTRLVRLSLDGSECVVELNSAFAGVSNQGTTGEAEAQNALCAALAAFPRVQTLRVMVDGAVFEGSHSGEWAGLPVRGGMPPSDEGE